jgi:hypothetical protein
MGSPRFAPLGAGGDEVVIDLAKAIGGEVGKFVQLGLVVGDDALGSEGATVNGGVKDVDG